MHERQELGPIQDRLPKSTTWLWQLREKLCRRRGTTGECMPSELETSECAVWKPNPLQALKHPVSCAKAYLQLFTWEMSWLIFCITKLEVTEAGHLPVQHCLFVKLACVREFLLSFMWSKNFHIESICGWSIPAAMPVFKSWLMFQMHLHISTKYTTDSICVSAYM